MEIKEKKVALVIVLKRLEDFMNFEYLDAAYRALEEPTSIPMAIGGVISLDNQDYEIREGIFRDVIRELEREKVIKTSGEFSSDEGPVWALEKINIEKVRKKRALLSMVEASLKSSKPLQAEPPKEEIDQTLEYDESRGVLRFKGKEILIAKSKDTQHSEVLRILFKDKKKLWNYDEIAEEIDPHTEYRRDDWRKYWQACNKINLKVAAETTVKDLVIMTAKTAMLNQKYLT